MTGIFGIPGERIKHISSRSPFLLSIFMRVEDRRLYSNVRKEEEEEREIEKEVEEHKVSRAIREKARWLKKSKKAQESALKLDMNQIFMYFHVVKAVGHFMSALDKFIDAARKSTVAQFITRVRNRLLKILPKFIEEIKQVLDVEGTDIRTLYGLISDTAEKGLGKLIINLRTAFKNAHINSLAVQFLERRAMKADIKIEYITEVDLKHVSEELERIDDAMLKKGAKEDTYMQALNRFESLMNRSEDDMPRMFTAAHNIMKRDAIEMAIVLSDERLMEHLGAQWLQKHYMPEVDISKTQLSIQKLEKAMAGKIHDISTGLNIIMKRVRELELGFERELDAAIKLPRAA